ncbi:MAG: ABC-2 transporter permease [Lachnospiraceae bacterium]|nr:ABC-2 transporter permease [Lachnospiraceae bacterium]
MKGLLLHDLFIMKKQGKTYLLFLLFFACMGFVSGNVAFFSSFLAIYAVSFGSSVFTYHEQCNWDAYANTLPLNRKQIIGSLYLLNGLALLLGGSFSLLGNLFLVLNREISMEEYIALTVTIFTVGAFMISFDLPLFLKFGCERGRTIMMGSYIVLFLAFMIAGKFLPGLGVSLTEEAVYRALCAACILALLCLCISYRISVGIYRKKEF